MSAESMGQIGRVVAHRDDVDGKTADLVPAPKEWAMLRAQEIHW